MKLNLECIRSVMLSLERELSFTDDGDCLTKNDVSLERLCELLPEYQKEDIFYSLFNLDQAGYLNISVHWSSDSVYECLVNYMTYDGHEFLNEIRDGKRWNKVKSITTAIRNYSLSAVSSIAEGVTNAAISAFLSKE